MSHWISWNPRMVCFGRDLKYHLIPTSTPWFKGLKSSPLQKAEKATAKQPSCIWDPLLQNEFCWAELLLASGWPRSSHPLIPKNLQQAAQHRHLHNLHKISGCWKGAPRSSSLLSTAWKGHTPLLCCLIGLTATSPCPGHPQLAPVGVMRHKSP